MKYTRAQLAQKMIWDHPEMTLEHAFIKVDSLLARYGYDAVECALFGDGVIR